MHCVKLTINENESVLLPNMYRFFPGMLLLEESDFPLTRLSRRCCADQGRQRKRILSFCYFMSSRKLFPSVYCKTIGICVSDTWSHCRQLPTKTVQCWKQRNTLKRKSNTWDTFHRNQQSSGWRLRKWFSKDFVGQFQSFGSIVCTTHLPVPWFNANAVN